MNIGNAYFSENTYMNHAAVNPAFSLMYSWNKSENFAEKYSYLDEHKRAACYAPLYPPRQKTVPGNCYAPHVPIYSSSSLKDSEENI